MQKKTAVPGAALCAGIIGALLRGWERGTVFEPGTGLATPWRPVTVLLALLTAAVLLLSYCYGLREMKDKKKGMSYREAFADGNWYSVCVSALLGLAVFLAALGMLPVERTEARSQYVAAVAQVILCAATGISMMCLAVESRGKGKSSVLTLLAAVPALFYCLWLATLYRRNAGNPVLLSYVYGCLAYGVAAIAFYFIAGFAYGRTNAAATLSGSLAAIYLLAVALFETEGLPARVAVIGTLVFLVQNTVRFMASPDASAAQKTEEPSGQETPTDGGEGQTEGLDP